MRLNMNSIPLYGMRYIDILVQSEKRKQTNLK